MKTKRLQFVILAASAFAFAANVQASITGSIWEAPNSGLVDGSSDSVPATAPGYTPDVTFSVANGPVNFDSRSGGNNSAYYTIGTWLNTDPGGATILTGSGALVNTINDCLVQLTGEVTVTSGQSFSVAHDDGLTLTIGGILVINAGGPTPPTVTTVTYTGPSGTFAFDLLYAEVDGAPAVLNVDLPLQPVPEPTTMIAGALLLLPFGASTLRILRKSRTA
jgi:hypothetical protein